MVSGILRRSPSLPGARCARQLKGMSVRRHGERVSGNEPGQITYPWNPRKAASVDAILLPWAESAKLQVLTQHGEAEVRCVLIVDDSGDTYDLVVNEPNEAEEVGVVAGLRSRAAQRVWRREAERFTFSRTVPISALAETLDEALAKVLQWVAQSGHTRTPA